MRLSFSCPILHRQTQRALHVPASMSCLLMALPLRNRSSCRPWKLMKIFKRNGHRMANTFTIQTPTTQHRNRKIVSPRHIRFSVWRTQVAHRKKSKKTRCGPVSLQILQRSSMLRYTSTSKNKLYVADTNGDNPQEVILNGSGIPEIVDAPIFLPDGQSILFSAPVPPQAYQPTWLDKLMGVQIAKAHDVPSDWYVVSVSGVSRSD